MHASAVPDVTATLAKKEVQHALAKTTADIGEVVKHTRADESSRPPQLLSAEQVLPSAEAFVAPKPLLPKPSAPWIRTGMSFAAIAAAVSAPAPAALVPPASRKSLTRAAAAVAASPSAAAAHSVLVTAVVEPALPEKVKMDLVVAAVQGEGAHAACEEVAEALPLVVTDNHPPVADTAGAMTSRHSNGSQAKVSSSGDAGPACIKQRSFAEIVALAAAAATNAGLTAAATNAGLAASAMKWGKRSGGNDVSALGRSGSRSAVGSSGGAKSPNHIAAAVVGKARGGSEGGSGSVQVVNGSNLGSVSVLAEEAVRVASTIAVGSVTGLSVVGEPEADLQSSSGGGAAPTASTVAPSAGTTVEAQDVRVEPAPLSLTMSVNIPKEPEGDRSALQQAVAAVSWADEVEEQDAICPTAAPVASESRKAKCPTNTSIRALCLYQTQGCIVLPSKARVLPSRSWIGPRGFLILLVTAAVLIAAAVRPPPCAVVRPG